MRAARALLGWTISELAEKAKISRNTVALMERNEDARNCRSRKKVADALDAAGVEIVPRDDSRGGGVRFKSIQAEERAVAESLAKFREDKACIAVEVRGHGTRPSAVACDKCAPRTTRQSM
ncbi:helix-turn-helix transcriptional regulator [Rhizobium sp. KVB221]|uniref:Helix-turn-helix transcriptional regulator n=1 Tax=Rhizobium setariae TaxID=2801340 RepID=A0A936YSL7_9HYPH|nr:helix-turn-helix transcriptional regulator [Rhizobium setariae]